MTLLYRYFSKILLIFLSSLLQPQILQPFNRCLNEHLHQGRVVKPPPTEGHSDLTRSRSVEGTLMDADRRLEGLMADVTRPSFPNGLLSNHLHFPGSGAPRGGTARDSPTSAAPSSGHVEGRAPAVMLQNSIAPRSIGPAYPRLLQPPRLHKRVSLPALKPGGAGGFASLKPGSSLGPLANRTKQLPPPSRGLPCFSAGPQVPAPSLRRTSLLQPRGASDPCRDPRISDSPLEEPDQGTLKDPGSGKILISLSRSCLPKPKIPWGAKSTHQKLKLESIWHRYSCPSSPRPGNSESVLPFECQRNKHWPSRWTHMDGSWTACAGDIGTVSFHISSLIDRHAVWQSSVLNGSFQEEEMSSLLVLHMLMNAAYANTKKEYYHSEGVSLLFCFVLFCKTLLAITTF